MQISMFFELLVLLAVVLATCTSDTVPLKTPGGDLEAAASGWSGGGGGGCTTCGGGGGWGHGGGGGGCGGGGCGGWQRPPPRPRCGGGCGGGCGARELNIKVKVTKHKRDVRARDFYPSSRSI